MMRYLIFLIVLLPFPACHNTVNTDAALNPIDKEKRDILVRKYDLMNFADLKQPVLMSLDEFFDGNNDEASIAPNLIAKPKVATYYKVLKKLEESPRVSGIFVKISDINIYDDGKLNDKEWFYADMICIVGDITKEEVKEATITLLPDAVEYTGGQIRADDERFKSKNSVYLWWD
jgi:hypothetical protein